jgi:hypothetical protein
MDSQLTLYCIRQKSTGYYLPAREAGLNNYSSVKPMHITKAMPRFFTQVKYALVCLDHWLQGVTTRVLHYNSEYGPEEDWKTEPRGDRLLDDFDIVPVYVTISKLSVSDIADLDQADATVKERIKQLGLTCVKGGK